MIDTAQNIAILGSTGSIGRQTLDVCRQYPNLFRPTILAAGKNVDRLIEQAMEFRPRLAIIADERRYRELHNALSHLGIETASGDAALAGAMDRDDYSTVVTATVGYSGLAPTIRAIRAGRRIALANKETLVVAGELITRMLERSKSRIVPVDSEHSAIYQCLEGEDRSSVSRLIITASGGPFRTKPQSELATVTVADALNHPNWSMGAKITIDSATMLNKAFEIIEARWLFDIPPERIEAVVHPQSIVHSMVEFTDGAIKAQLGIPDMHLPISYALADTVRLPGAERRLSIADYARLTFEQPDTHRFPCLTLADYALRRGGNTACIINAANEVANAAFLHGRIKFTDIYTSIIKTLDAVSLIAAPSYDDYVATNTEARRRAEEIVNSIATL